MTDELVDHRGVAVPPGDRAQVLRDQLHAGNVPRWTPTAGDVLVGAFVRIEHGYEKHSGSTPILIVAAEPDGREIGVWLHHKALVEKIADVAPVIGERVGIKFEGAGPSGNAYRYKVRADRPAGTKVDWNAIAGRETPAAASTTTEAPAVSVDASLPESVTEPIGAGAPRSSDASTVTEEPPPAAEPQLPEEELEAGPPALFCPGCGHPTAAKTHADGCYHAIPF